MHGHSLTHAIQLPDDFSWDKPVGLLLDALQVENLLYRLYEWSPAPEVDVLYSGTIWAGISQISPCLVRLRTEDDPILLQFLAHAADNWGYLLVSDGSWEDLLAHMRGLTRFCPTQHDDMYLRISHPDVAHALFAPEHHPGVEVFGPCQTILAIQSPLPEWRQYQRPGDRPLSRPDKLFTPNEAQWAALEAIARRRSMDELYQHVNRFFPQYLADLPAEQRMERIHQLVASAREQGFRTRRDIWLYVTIFGFLGDEGVQARPDIVELLTNTSGLTAHQRINRAATLAQQRTTR